MKKILYFDTETTGRKPLINEIHQIGIIIEINGEVKFKGEFKTRPLITDQIVQEALEVSGVTEKEILKYPHPVDTYKKIITLLGQYVDKYDPTDKFYPAGYNVKFDLEFLQQYFLYQDDKFLGSWFNWRSIDPLNHLYSMDCKGEINLPNYQLKTVCKHFNINLENAHDAMADIEATRKLIKKMNLV